jgi:hypothetical protein
MWTAKWHKCFALRSVFVSAYHKLSNSVEHSASWEPSNYTVSKESPKNLWNQIPILFLRFSAVLLFYPFLGLQGFLILLVFLAKLLYHACQMPRSSYLPGFCYLKFSEDYKLLSFPCHRFLQPTVKSSLRDPSVFLRILFLNTPSACSYLIWRTKFHTHIKQQSNS